MKNNFQNNHEWQCLESKIINFVSDYYNQDKRYYHNYLHISEMINWCNTTFKDIIKPDQKIAIYFHDVIYDPASNINEENSVHLMKYFFNIEGNQIPQDIIEKASLIILDTKDHSKPSIEESKLVLDLDLERLSRSYYEFLYFSELISYEYNFISKDVFNKNRKKFFEKMILQERIFHTPYGIQHWEQNVRNNINDFLTP
jgi:predicted metal-dependent HD superfamily phosphohydrolase